MDFNDPIALRDLAEQKEKEWKDLAEKRLQVLEDSVKQKDGFLKQQQEQFIKLKEDFKYNLCLLEERDQELERYDLAFADLKAQLNIRNAEISELRIQLDDVKKAQQREQLARDDLHASYQQRLREKQAEIEAFKSTKNGELTRERAEFESLRRKLQRQLTDLDADLDRQRHELTTEFEDALKKREHEFRIQTDEMSAKVLEYDLKAQLLGKEIELLRGERERQSTEVEAASQSHRDLEKQLKQTQWQLADTTAIKDARIKDLEEQLKRQEKATAKLQEDFHRKYAELDKAMREREASVHRLKSACEEKEQTLIEQTQALQSKLEDANIQIRQLQWTNNDLKKDHEMHIEKLQNELLDLKTRWDTHVKDMSRDAVTRDVELQGAQEEISRLRSELAQRKDDLLRYKKELLQAVEREKALEQAKAQLDIDWQRRCEEMERRQYDKSEDLIVSLTGARDEALAAAKEKGRELEQATMLLRAVTRDHDHALATLKKHDIPLDKNLKISSEKYSEQELENLREQNSGLRAALAAMRQQMESIGQVMPPSVAVSAQHSPEHTESLEKELKELKRQNVELAEKVAQAEKFGHLVARPPQDSQHILSEVKDTGVRSHILSLNNMMGVLRGEKVELAAIVKKQQARLQHLEAVLEETSKQPQELQVTIEQLRYENGAQQRRHAAEAAALRQQVSQLQGQLTEAQREADMFHQASVENNAELTALRNQVSVLKLDLAEKRPAINFGAQELLIQQLQEELSSLRNRANQLDIARQGKGDYFAFPGDVGGGTSVSEWKGKLVRAAKHIAQLVREKQQLTELSNRLQAELKQAGMQMSVGVDRLARAKHLPASVEPKDSALTGRLSQLEHLQYQLTKQELQYAQRFAPPVQGEEDLHGIPEKEKVEAKDGDSGRMQQKTTAPGNVPATSSMLASMDFSISSVGGQSLQDVWRLLDSPASPDLIRSQEPSGYTTSVNKQSLRLSDEDGNIAVHGRRLAMDKKDHTSGTKVKAVVNKARKVKTPHRPGVRNYNLRDDGEAG